MTTVSEPTSAAEAGRSHPDPDLEPKRLLTMSATGLAKLIRTGRTTSRAVVEAHIDHCRRVNPTLNAIVRDRYEEALAEADAADAALLTTGPEDLPPLHGVPFSIKESIAVAGMPQTAGFKPRTGYVASEDATVVARLRAAGAIPIGVTNTSELCLWMETSNLVYGRTNNPYDPGRTVGGSSGGEGAIVGAGGSPFGVGADIGGSIRMPAFFNGVFGHKPSGGLVPGTGQFPMPENAALRCLGTGPIARRAEDLMPLVRLMSGPDGCDPVCSARNLKSPAEVDLSTIDVVSVAGDGLLPVSRDLKTIQKRAAHVLAVGGAGVRHEKFPVLRRSLEMWAAMMVANADTKFCDLYGNGRRVYSTAEFVRWAIRRSDHTLPAVTLLLLEKLFGAMPARNERIIRKAREFRQELCDLLGDRGVLLYPSYPTVAPRHSRPLMLPVKWAYTAIFNVLELPVTQVPLGLDRRGLPLGMQVVSSAGNDHLTIAVALEMERVFGGWRPPARWFGAQAGMAAPR